MTMADHIYSISELVGSSSVSIDDAIKGAITRASKTLHQVTLKVGFRVDDPS
jgi:flavin-binding protein dodecin